MASSVVKAAHQKVRHWSPVWSIAHYAHCSQKVSWTKFKLWFMCCLSTLMFLLIFLLWSLHQQPWLFQAFHSLAQLAPHALVTQMANTSWTQLVQSKLLAHSIWSLLVHRLRYWWWSQKPINYQKKSCWAQLFTVMTKCKLLSTPLTNWLLKLASQIGTGLLLLKMSHLLLRSQQSLKAHCARLIRFVKKVLVQTSSKKLQKQ